MPGLREYRIFVSHAWDYNSEYYRLLEMLDNAPNFNYRNYSVPEHDPVKLSRKTKKELKEALDRQIKPTQCIIVIAGMYAAYREWIEFEIGVANYYEKPIIGIWPRGARQTPSIVSQNAIDMVGWNTNSIVQAVRKYSL